jgi:hypothetical protein
MTPQNPEPTGLEPGYDISLYCVILRKPLISYT